ncbi:LCP family protein [Actinospica durhamensis]|uniref:LCP family protein n=1 Tax=Actinospica durhamensis TaxID=1508375 RepID=A0A941ESA7_9ACTN|nr:LCP family protein [Actinospica durhamensis]MBR7837485.1 LCP family protein [Actinospica durhamensis]
MDGVRGYPREQPEDLWRPPQEPGGEPGPGPGRTELETEPDGPDEAAEPAAYGSVRFPAQRPWASPTVPRTPRVPRAARPARAARPTRPTRPSGRPRAPLYGSPLGEREAWHVNEDVDLAELDPHGGARRRAAVKVARIQHPRKRRRQVLRITTGLCAAIVLGVAGLGTYAYNHLFGQVATESLAGLANRPAAARADRWGNVPENILLLGSQTRDGQHGLHLGNSSKLGTDISDTAMLVHISAERKWATVVSIPRDLVVPRPQCQGRLDPTQAVPAASAAMFDLAMNLGGPTCAVATVEQMTGIRIDHFVEINFNAFQSLTAAVGGVTVCVPPPGINDPDYSGLVLGPGLHTISGAQSLAFVRDRHGLADGTDLNRIRMQQMFVSSLFNKLAGAGTLGDPITLYRIANAVTSNLTVDTGLDSIDAMVGLAGSVQSLQSHYIQFITVPYDFDPTNQNRVIPGAGFDEAWADLRQDTPLPGSNAARSFGTAPSAAATSAPAAPTLPMTGTEVDVYNGTQVPHLALYASENLSALGVTANVGEGSPIGAAARTEVLYPTGQRARAENLAAHFGGTGAVRPVQSASVHALTLVIGLNPPTSLVTQPVGGAGPGSPADTASADGLPAAAAASPDASGAATPVPNASISAESRSGDENICSDLPSTVSFGGKP